MDEGRCGNGMVKKNNAGVELVTMAKQWTESNTDNGDIIN